MPLWLTFCPKISAPAVLPCSAFFTGLGAVVASALPWILSNVFHLPSVSATCGPFRQPFACRSMSAAFSGAVLWTVVTTPGYPPENIEAFKRARSENAGLTKHARVILDSIANMPTTMRQLGRCSF